jgi:hypothetical protein
VQLIEGIGKGSRDVCSRSAIQGLGFY